jgi:hypothetical protein
LEGRAVCTLSPYGPIAAARHMGATDMAVVVRRQT